MRGIRSGVVKRIHYIVNGGIIDVGGCSLHHVHNAARRATQCTKLINLEDTISHIFNYFRYKSNSDYKVIANLLEVETHKFIRLIPTRWLNVLM